MTTTAPATEVRRPTARPPQAQPAIEDNALIGDLHTAGLVAKNGSIDFLCLPDFDDSTTFASLLGTPENGEWKIAPVRPAHTVRRRYRGNTLILETEFENDEGVVRLTDFMPIRRNRHDAPRVIRILEAVRGQVTVRFDLRPRFAYGYTIPIELSRDSLSSAVAGPDALYLRGGREGAPPFHTDLVLDEGERVTYELAWTRPYDNPPPPVDVDAALRETEAFWNDWSAKIRLPAEYKEVVMRSLITLKACTYAPSGAVVAAPTFGLPETPGGERNWDYRFTWIRDSVLALHALIRASLTKEAEDFATWLQDAIGGSPSQIQIMYGIRGDRILTENTLPWLEGHGGAKPVRIGNGAYSQFQLDVLGELLAVVYSFVKAQGDLRPSGRAVIREAVETVARTWQKKDHGIWESRGPMQSFVASKVSAWVAIDRWVRLIDLLDLDEDRPRWESLRDEIRNEILEKGFDAKRNTFTQYYGSTNVDASLLFIPMTGFLPANDPRVVGTVKAIEEELMQDGLVLRYRTDASDDGLSGEEGVFLACSFWLVNTYHLMGRTEDARKLFEHVANLRNDVGLLAEEYLTSHKRQIGNFPQAFSHLALVNAAYTITENRRPAEHPDS